MTWLGAGDNWPSHPRSLANEAQKEAKQQGWLYKPGGHGGLIRCPLPEHRNDVQPCIETIFSSSGSRDGAVTASVIRRALARCQAKRAASGAPTDASILSQLERIEELFEHGRRMEAAARMSADAESMLDQAPESQSVSETNELLDTAIGAEESARAMEEESWRGAAEFDLDVPWPPDPPLSVAAADRLIELEESLEVIAMTTEVRERIQELKRRMTPDSP